MCDIQDDLLGTMVQKKQMGLGEDLYVCFWSESYGFEHAGRLEPSQDR